MVNVLKPIRPPSMPLAIYLSVYILRPLVGYLDIRCPVGNRCLGISPYTLCSDIHVTVLGVTRHTDSLTEICPRAKDVDFVSRIITFSPGSSHRPAYI